MRIRDWSSDVCSSDLRLAMQHDVLGRMSAAGHDLPLPAGEPDLLTFGDCGVVVGQIGHVAGTGGARVDIGARVGVGAAEAAVVGEKDRKSTRLNSSH